MLSLNYENINYVKAQNLKLSCVSFSYVSISYVLAHLMDVSTGASGATMVAPKIWDTLRLLQPGGQILPTIAEVAPKFFPWLRPCI